MPSSQLPPVFRFAPSPNGKLHLGHAYSALLNEKLARQAGGKLLLRIEDVDRQRSRPEFEAAIQDDLRWLGIAFEGPVRRQSEHLALYQQELDKLINRGLAYYSPVSRSEIVNLAAQNTGWPRDPDGALLPPRFVQSSKNIIGPCSIRLNMTAALAVCGEPAAWNEAGTIVEYDARLWGDVVLKSRDGSFAYHLAVVIDDAAQHVTQIVRGRDLYAATAVHRVLQRLFQTHAPDYVHHELVLDESGEKLAKSKQSPSLQSLRQQGFSALQLRQRLGFSA